LVTLTKRNNEDEMTIETEFPDYPAADVPTMPQGFVDASWHNDACPSFHNAAKRLTIWLDYVEIERREFEKEGRFQLVRTDDDGATMQSLVITDSWAEIVARIAEEG
jgi:hypothetical protein